MVFQKCISFTLIWGTSPLCSVASCVMSNVRAKPFHAGVIFVNPCTSGFDNCFSFTFGLCVVVRASHFHITSVLCQWDGELSSHLISSTDDPLYFGSMMSLVAKGKCHNLTLLFSFRGLLSINMLFLWISLSLCGFHRTGVLLVLCLGSLIPKESALPMS